MVSAGLNIDSTISHRVYNVLVKRKESSGYRTEFSFGCGGFKISEGHAGGNIQWVISYTSVPKIQICASSSFE